MEARLSKSKCKVPSVAPSLRSGFRQRAQTPAKQLNFISNPSTRNDAAFRGISLRMT
jgi:hypothetical protein